MENKHNFMETESITKLLIKFSIPAIVGMFVNALYNVVDRIYIGNIKDIGHLGITGIGVVFPVVILIFSFSLLIGIGSAAAVSLKLGMKDREEAERFLGVAVFLSFIISTVLMLLIYFYMDKIIYFIGGSDKTFIYAKDYLFFINLGVPAAILGLVLNSVIRSDGSPKIAMGTLLLGAITNIVLDPIFIYVLHMNVAGAALATIISQFVSCIWVLSFLFGKKTIIKIRKEYLLFDKNIMKKILGLGFTPFFMSSTEGILQVAFNRQLLLYGGDLSVSAMTILLSMSQILSLPMEGIAQGAQPIISYNFGAKKYNRVKETIKITIKVALTYSIIGVLLMEAFPQVFVSLFANNTQLIQLSYQLLRIYIFGFIIMGAFSTFQQTYNALGCGKNAFFFAFFRKIILLIPLIYLLPFILPSYGVYAVVLAEPISDLMTTILNGVYFKHFVKKTLA